MQWGNEQRNTNSSQQKFHLSAALATLMEVARSMKYSELLSVWEGATTMESPVCTPRGSKFSMLHT